MPKLLALALGALALTSAAALRAPQEDAPALWRLVQEAVAARGQGEPAGVVLQHMAGVPVASRAARRLTRVERGLREPWAVPALAEELRDLLARPVHEGRRRELAALVPPIAAWLDLDPTRGRAEGDLGLAALEAQWRELVADDLRGVALLEALSELLATAHAVLAEDLGSLAPEARALLFEDHAAFCEAWYRGHFPESRADERASAEQEALVERFQAEILIPDRGERARSLAVAGVLLRLTSQDFLASLRARLREVPLSREEHAGFAGDVRAVVGADESVRVVLGGPRPTSYEAAAALVIDLGGNDTYARAAVVDREDALVSLVLDLGGDDTYAASAPGPAYAAGGVAILLDAGGDDTYRSRRLGQGASALGFALLCDLDGDDVYDLEDYGQGHALCGVGLLYDLAGDDAYSAWAYAQGGGIGYGLAALVDGDGDDRYLADGHWPDVYGDSGPESFHGASQGYSTGLRPRLAGGLAALLDLGDGRDAYRSGNFSQGGGYYFAFGLLYDDGGDDENRGYRYSQGFGVHQALGMRWDADGDDSYACRSVAHAGMAWDEGVGWFLDERGDDTYRVGGLALGAAAQTGVAVFVDGRGEDAYESGGQSQGATGGSDYHGKPSLGVLIDLGGQADSYSAPERGDERLRVDAGVGVFLDTRARTVEQALRAQAWRD